VSIRVDGRQSGKPNIDECSIDSVSIEIHTPVSFRINGVPGGRITLTHRSRRTTHHRTRPVHVIAALLGAAFLMFAVMLRPAEASYAAIVIDANTGAILHEDDADKLNYPASLTKMMTLYLTFEALNKGKLKLGQMLPVSSRAASQPPTRLGLRPGQRITVEQAVLALVTRSANDAAVVLGEALGGSEKAFAVQMTKKARLLGMKSTTFRNASGLPDDAQASTARDLSKLASALIRHHPKYYPYFKRGSFTYRGEEFRNHNRLMSRYPGMDGLKTGYINASGYNLAASAVRNKRRLIAVVMGGPSATWRDDRMAELLDAAFMKPAPPSPPVRTAQAPAAKKVAAAGTETVDHAALSRMAEAIRGQGDAVTFNDVNLVRSAVAADEMAGSWGIQIGAFGSPTAAHRAINSVTGRFPKMLDGADPQLVGFKAADGMLYRARLVGLEEEAAQSVCAALVRSGGECMALAPDQM